MIGLLLPCVCFEGIPPSVNDSPSSQANQGAGGASGSNEELIRDILVAIGREELADSPVAVDLMKDVLAQTDGDTMKAADLMLEMMAGGNDDQPGGRTGSSSIQPPGGSGRGTSLQDDLPVAVAQGLDNPSADPLSDQIYQVRQLMFPRQHASHPHSEHPLYTSKQIAAATAAAAAQVCVCVCVCGHQ